MSQPILKEVSFKEHQACTKLSLSWANSYDTKDWALLSTIVTPKLHIDYRSVMGPTHLFADMPAADYIAMMSSPATLGNPLVATQHILGLASFERTSENEITGTLQVRAHHLRFASDGCGDMNGYEKGINRKVLASATGYARLQHFYRRDAEGTWKIAGLQPTVLFNEGDLKALFALKEDKVARGVHS